MSIKVPNSTSWLVIIIVILVAIYIGWGPHSQSYNLKVISKWLTSNEASLIELKKMHTDLSECKVSRYTGGNGKVLVILAGVVSKDSAIAFYDWILKSNPPRPIHYVNKMIISDNKDIK
jgi:uncharacterized protein YpmB